MKPTSWLKSWWNRATNLNTAGFKAVFRVSLSLIIFGISFYASSRVLYAADSDYGLKLYFTASAADPTGQNFFGAASRGVVSSQRDFVGFRFTAPRDMTISTVKLYVADEESSAVSNFRVYITGGGLTPAFTAFTDGSLGQTDTLAYGNFSDNITDGTWISISMSSGTASLSAGQSYSILFTTPLGGVVSGTEYSFGGPSPWDANNRYWSVSGGSTCVSDSALDALITTDGGDNWAAVNNIAPPFVIVDSLGGTHGQAYTHFQNQAFASTVRLGQTFTPDKDMYVTAISARVNTSATIPNGDLMYVIVKDPGGAGQALLSSGTFVNSGGLDTALVWKTVSFPAMLLNAGTKYRLYLEHPFTSNGGSYNWSSVYSNLTNYDYNANFGGSSNLSENTSAGSNPFVETNWSAGGTGSTTNDRSFYLTIDQTAPTAAITLPASGAWRSSLTQIQGTARDTYYLSGGSIAIRNIQAGKYWDGSNYNSTTIVWFSTPIASSVADETVNWYYSFANWEHDTQYTIYFKARDMAENFQPQTSLSYIYDNSSADMASRVTLPNPADSTRKDPQGRLWYNSLATISGTANDNLGSDRGQIDYIDYLVTRLNPALGADIYFNGSGWQPTEPSWPTADPVPVNADNTTWNKTGLGAIWGAGSGSSFTVTARMTDKAAPSANRETLLVGVTFYWDIVVPTATISSPSGSSGSNGRVGSSLGGFGGYYDEHSGVSLIEYRLFDKTDNKYWDGTGWFVGDGDSVEWPNASLWSSSWTVENAPTFGAGEDGDTIIMAIRAKDYAGSYQTDFTDGLSSNTFRVDLTPPNAAG